MTQEVTTELRFDVNYTPSEIKIENEEQLQKIVEAVSARYSALVFTDDNIPEAKKARADLNKIAERLDTERKKVKKEYSAPLKAFESTINQYRDQIKDVSDGINVSIRSYEDEQTKIRYEKIASLINEMMEPYELTADDLIAANFEIESAWTNKAALTTKGEATLKTVKAIKDRIGYISQEKKRVIADKETVRQFAELSGLEPYAWDNLIDQGFTSAEVIDRIKAGVEEKKREEERKAARAKANAEYEAEIAKLEAEKQQVVDDKTIDVETGEIVQKRDKRKKVTLEIYGTDEQFRALINYMKENDLSCRRVEK